jgi:hypothetical protein
LVGGIAQDLSKSPGGGIQSVIEIHMDIPAPDPLPELLAAHHLPRVFQEAEEEFEGLFLHAEAFLPLPEFSRGGVQFETAKRQTVHAAPGGTETRPIMDSPGRGSRFRAHGRLTALSPEGPSAGGSPDQHV